MRLQECRKGRSRALDSAGRKWLWEERSDEGGSRGLTATNRRGDWSRGAHAHRRPDACAAAPGPWRTPDGAWREDPKGRRVEVLYPISDSAFDGANWPKGGIYPLAPFSNRVRNGRFSFAAARSKLPPHPASAPHAVHGFSHQLPWVVTEQTAATAALHFRHDAPANAEGWPWAFEAWQRFALDGAGLTHEIGIVTNAGADADAGRARHASLSSPSRRRPHPLHLTGSGRGRDCCALRRDPLRWPATASSTGSTLSETN